MDIRISVKIHVSKLKVKYKIIILQNSISKIKFSETQLQQSLWPLMHIAISLIFTGAIWWRKGEGHVFLTLLYDSVRRLGHCKGSIAIGSHNFKFAEVLKQDCAWVFIHISFCFLPHIHGDERLKFHNADASITFHHSLLLSPWLPQLKLRLWTLKCA